MNEVSVTLVTDGSSDASLIPVLEWLLRELGVSVPRGVSHADCGRPRRPPKELAKRIAYTLCAYPCDILFIHRDAEKQDPDLRRGEIEAAIRELTAPKPPCVCVVPVRMTEAWLLFDERAIRRASGNPNGRVKLSLPRLADVEQVPDPKSMLHDLLIESSELTGRGRKKFDTREAARLVALRLEDFSRLRELSAFQVLESDTRQILKTRFRI